ncbi:DUF6259 domain-containing protein [Mahella australiensis]|uniref:DUF6259 domain-containing protein n=1 Tax=Mahella australiensis (strain DSM 15567 / CIP 107919 / 50-1 BON) TaxID=697281 RepID=F3ZVM6_MAHA5|nr:DUF6259 domain-containing protein [Mahella australiensis]AEE96388.1 hypothetical protein Mahau_1192 [Mahella australiensis 50-1 BON]
MNTIVLKNDNLYLEFEASNGALIGLTAVNTGWKMLDRSQLGLSFRLLIPLPGRRNNPVYGEKQKVSDIHVSPDNSSAVFVWNGVASEYGGRHDIKLTMEVKLNAEQVIYAVHIDNNSEYTVENVYCPYLGDIQHPPADKQFEAFIYNYGSAQQWALWPIYQNTRGYYGVDYPMQFGPPSACGAPTAPFCLLHGATQGLYVGVYEPSAELVAWHTELRPGYGSSIDSRVPEEFNISGKDVATRFAAVHVPYIQPGESRDLTPIMLQTFEGGWQKGVDIYKQWRNSWMKTSEVPTWAMEPHAWQQIHINSSEDELRIPFRDLVKIGEDCARNKVKAIQLVGWNDGGQDQGNPSHDPDPRLGTFEELREAIAKIQSMGVKVVLFSKFTWADRATERFRKDLIKLAVKDPYGDYYMHQGYQYQTATQLLDINTKRLIPMCFLSEEYLRVCEEEFKKVLELGADGILFDECLHHGPALLCFDTSHGHRYGAPVYANDRKLIQNFARMVQDKPDFLFAGEACYDWEFEAYHLSYHRSESKYHIPLMRYMLPNMPIMTAVTGFNDRNMINQCLMYRYIISYEPYNFKGRLGDFPETVAYGRQMDALRTELRDYFWDGEFRHECGAAVFTMDGQPYRPYAVFINAKSGRAGVVIANYDEYDGVTVKVELDNADSLERYRLVDDDQWKSVEEGISIPPCSAVVII